MTKVERVAALLDHIRKHSGDLQKMKMINAGDTELIKALMDFSHMSDYDALRKHMGVSYNTVTGRVHKLKGLIDHDPAPINMDEPVTKTVAPVTKTVTPAVHSMITVADHEAVVARLKRQIVATDVCFKEIIDAIKKHSLAVK